MEKVGVNKSQGVSSAIYSKIFVVRSLSKSINVQIENVYIDTGLFEMIVGVLTTCRTQYTWDNSICFLLFNRTTLQVLLHTVQFLYLCTICDSTDINTIIEYVPNCL